MVNKVKNSATPQSASTTAKRTRASKPAAKLPSVAPAVALKKKATAKLRSKSSITNQIEGASTRTQNDEDDNEEDSSDSEDGDRSGTECDEDESDDNADCEFDELTIRVPLGSIEEQVATLRKVIAQLQLSAAGEGEEVDSCGGCVSNAHEHSGKVFDSDSQ